MNAHSPHKDTGVPLDAKGMTAVVLFAGLACTRACVRVCVFVSVCKRLMPAVSSERGWMTQTEETVRASACVMTLFACVYMGNLLHKP